ncbi:stAR-related lipid transfer protein 4 isoform X2 [Bubalus kerabau]|uniref:stAR-related lipid transfer protein 4 isoform X2 n=1 Tax=Bubalus carabanensis TaxID=3119969 RepID=UPI00244EE946|nr:stAR-related lipid transfer protein 4 isoform X2 [Bubalus carabanensis]
MEALPDTAVLATRLKNTLIQYHNLEDEKWRVAKKTKDVTIWRKPSEEFNGYLFKAQGVIGDAANSVIDHIRPGPCRLDWDSLMTSLDILEHFEENCCVMRYTTAGQLWNIISPREFVDFSYTVGYKEGLLSCGISLDWSEKRSEFVRGYNHPCGWFCVPLKESPSRSLLTGYIQTDLRGMIPQSAVDTAMKQTCSNFLRSKWDEEPCAKEKKSGVRESVPSCYQKEACKIPLRVYVQPFVNEETCSPTVDFGL